MLKHFKIAISVALIMLIIQVDAISQIGNNINIGAGIVTTNIISNNRATLPIVQSAGASFVGGSFEHAQPGIQLKGTYLFDNNPDLRFTTTFDYMLFSGRERYGIPPNVVVLYEHDVNIAALSIGLEYVWANLDFANAKLYSGLDIQGSSYHSINFVQYINYLDDYLLDSKLSERKSDAFRMGGNVRLGVEGRLRNRVYVNTGFAVGLLNLFGRDDERGELLTPKKIFEPKENILPIFQVFILIQYNM